MLDYTVSDAIDPDSVEEAHDVFFVSLRMDMRFCAGHRHASVSRQPETLHVRGPDRRSKREGQLSGAFRRAAPGTEEAARGAVSEAIFAVVAARASVRNRLQGGD